MFLLGYTMLSFTYALIWFLLKVYDGPTDSDSSTNPITDPITVDEAAYQSSPGNHWSLVFNPSAATKSEEDGGNYIT